MIDEELRAELDRHFGALSELIQRVFGGLEKRFEGLEKRHVNRSFDRRERTVSELRAAQQAQQKIIDDLAGRVQQLERRLGGS